MDEQTIRRDERTKIIREMISFAEVHKNDSLYGEGYTDAIWDFILEASTKVWNEAPLA